MSKLIFKKETHQYFLEDKELISVSKIIDNYLGFGYSHIALEVLKNASNRGKWVHKLNELYLQNINEENIINNLLKKLKPLTNNINYSYCKKSLIFLKEKFKDKNNYEFIIEKPIADNLIAGTPDLVYLDKKENKYYLVDYKTYACIDKDKIKRIKLQLTAYYCMLLDNGIMPSYKTYVYLTNKNTQQEIKIEITNELIIEWMNAKQNILKEKIKMEYKLEYCKNKKCNFNELLTKSINARIEFLEYQIEEINLSQINVWELDVLRGQIKELNILKNNIKEWLRRNKNEQM